MEMLETWIAKEKPPVVLDLDDYRGGERDRPHQAVVAHTPEHKVDLWTIQTGQGIPLHLHTDSECILIVLAGHGKYTEANGSYDLSKDMMTVVPPGTAHGIRNSNSEPLIVLTIEGPGPFDAKVLERESDEKQY